jgi:hypothetical protein
MSSIDTKIKQILEEKDKFKTLIPEDYQYLAEEDIDDFMESEEFENLSEEEKLSFAAYRYNDLFESYVDHLSKHDLEELMGMDLFDKLDESIKQFAIKKMQNWDSSWKNVDPFTGEELTPEIILINKVNYYD